MCSAFAFCVAVVCVLETKMRRCRTKQKCSVAFGLCDVFVCVCETKVRRWRLKQKCDVVFELFDVFVCAFETKVRRCRCCFRVVLFVARAFKKCVMVSPCFVCFFVYTSFIYTWPLCTFLRG